MFFKDKKRRDNARHEYEPIDHALITVLCDAMYGVMPALGGGLWWDISNPKLLRRGDMCCLLSSFL
jgi:hypothetical protein